MMDDAQIDEWVSNPRKYKKELKEMSDQVNALFTDPAALKEMIETMSGMAEMLSDPAKLEEALEEIAKEFEQWETDMNDDDKLEAARLEMLENPDLSSNPMLASVFNTDEMQEILKDSGKWKDAIKGGGAGRRRGGVGAAEL